MNEYIRDRMIVAGVLVAILAIALVVWFLTDELS